MSSNLEVVFRSAVAPGTSSSLVAGPALDVKLLYGITDEKLDTFKREFVMRKKVDNVDWDLVNIFGYEGFDATYVYRHVLAIQDLLKLTEEDRDKDICYLLVLQVLRGNVSEKNFKSFSPVGQASVSAMFSKWHLSLKITSDLKKTAVTLPRLSLAFPYQAAQIAKKVGKSFVGPFNSALLPKVFFTNSFASIIPPSMKVTKMLVFAYNCYATDQSIALSKQNYRVQKGDELMAKFAEQLIFTDIAFNSTVVDSSLRKSMMKLLGVTEHYDTIYKIVAAADKSKENVVTKAEWNKEFGLSGAAEELEESVVGPS